MANLALPAPPKCIAEMRPAQAQPKLLIWLMSVARECGERGVEVAIGDDWPGTAEQRAWITASHIEVICGEARRRAHERLQNAELWVRSRAGANENTEPCAERQRLHQIPIGTSNNRAET